MTVEELKKLDYRTAVKECLTTETNITVSQFNEIVWNWLRDIQNKLDKES